MRHLSAAQKKVLDEWARQGTFSVNELPAGEFARLEQMNDYETLWQDANRYLFDRVLDHR